MNEYRLKAGQFLKRIYRMNFDILILNILLILSKKSF